MSNFECVVSVPGQLSNTIVAGAVNYMQLSTACFFLQALLCFAGHVGSGFSGKLL